MHALVYFFWERISLIVLQTRRCLVIFRRNRSDLITTLSQGPLMAIAFYLVFSGSVPFWGQSKPLFEIEAAQTITFLSVLAAVWFGTSRAMCELPGYWRYYLQEKLSFLKDFDYIVSRFIYLASIAVLQCLLFTATFHLLFIILPAIQVPFDAGILSAPQATVELLSVLQLDILVELIALMILITLTSVAFAMLLSSFIPSTTTASTFLPFYLIIQILLAGSAIQPARNMSEGVYVVASLTASRWGYEVITIALQKNLVNGSERVQDDEDFLLKGDIFSKGLTESVLLKLYVDEKFSEVARLDDLLSNELFGTLAHSKLPVMLTMMSRLERRPQVLDEINIVLGNLASGVEAHQLAFSDTLHEMLFMKLNKATQKLFRQELESVLFNVAHGIELSDYQYELWQDYILIANGRPRLFTEFNYWKCIIAMVFLTLCSLALTAVGLKYSRNKMVGIA